MIGRWARRAAGLHGELREIAELGADPRWWVLAGGAAFAWERRATYVISDAEPTADTFIGHASLPPADPFADAVAHAIAARDALQLLDGQLPDQPLAMTVRRSAGGAIAEPSALGVAAFAIGERTWVAHLPRAGSSPCATGDARALRDDLAHVAAGGEPQRLRRLGTAGPTPFVCVTLGEEPLATARHGHRRAWLGNGTGHGPWLGLSRTPRTAAALGLAVVSTCHMILDGFGHVWLAEEIRARASAGSAGTRVMTTAVPAAVVPPGAVPLGVAWQPITGPIPSALPLAYALGRVLHRVAGDRAAPFSPTFQIPVAPGVKGDPERRRRRVVPAIASVRFDRGTPEPFAAFAARTFALLHREATGRGLSSHLLAAAQAVPAPLAWKRRAVGAHRPRWLDAVATLVGGRGCVSRIRMDLPDRAVTPACAVSSPGRLPSAADPLGGCVVTIVDDGRTGAITLCGAGFAETDTHAAALLAELLAALPEAPRVHDIER